MYPASKPKFAWNPLDQIQPPPVTKSCTGGGGNSVPPPLGHEMSLWALDTTISTP